MLKYYMNIEIDTSWINNYEEKERKYEQFYANYS